MCVCVCVRGVAWLVAWQWLWRAWPHPVRSDTDSDRQGQQASNSIGEARIPTSTTASMRSLATVPISSLRLRTA